MNVIRIKRGENILTKNITLMAGELALDTATGEKRPLLKSVVIELRIGCGREEDSTGSRLIVLFVLLHPLPDVL